jgi:hypothetical protein
MSEKCEHVAGVEDYHVALATYRAAVERWPGTPITLRQGTRVIEDSQRLRLAWVGIFGVADLELDTVVSPTMRRSCADRRAGFPG